MVYIRRLRLKLEVISLLVFPIAFISGLALYAIISGILQLFVVYERYQSLSVADFSNISRQLIYIYIVFAPVGIGSGFAIHITITYIVAKQLYEYQINDRWFQRLILIVMTLASMTSLLLIIVIDETLTTGIFSIESEALSDYLRVALFMILGILDTLYTLSIKRRDNYKTKICSSK